MKNYAPQTLFLIFVIMTISYVSAENDSPIYPAKSSSSPTTMKKPSKTHQANLFNFDFQKTEIKSVLQTIADVAKINIVATETVKGNVTLTLKNTPWSQALDTVLKMMQLEMYQHDNVITVAPVGQLNNRFKRKNYQGKPVSLNFQNIETRNILLILADFSDSNIVISDAVTGKITFQVNDLPLDLAFDIVLELKQLETRQLGNVTLIVPIGQLNNPNKEKNYKGDLLSLNFQKVSNRSILGILADFSDLNILVDDAVAGTISILINDTPWDLALEAILQSNKFEMRQINNVIIIAPIGHLGHRFKEKTYEEGKLSLNFQDIKIKEALQQLSDMDNLNISVSEQVVGNVTFLLNNVSSELALDIILLIKRLKKCHIDNVTVITPIPLVKVKNECQ